MRLFILCITSLFFISCHSGEWENQDKNWERAFSGQSKPDNVKILNSYYWRSPHFTYEAQYFFRLEVGEEYMNTWIQHSKCKLTASTVVEADFPNDRPDWFVPKELSKYKIWRPSDDQFSQFRIFKNLETNEFYVTDTEL